VLLFDFFYLPSMIFIRCGGTTRVHVGIDLKFQIWVSCSRVSLVQLTVVARGLFALIDSSKAVLL
jgi:hypothetical protein